MFFTVSDQTFPPHHGATRAALGFGYAEAGDGEIGRHQGIFGIEFVLNPAWQSTFAVSHSVENTAHV